MNKGIPAYEINGHIPTMVGTEVTYPEKGGILTKIKGMKVPLKGLPFPQFIYAIDPIKRVIKIFLKELLADKIALVLFLCRPWRWKRIKRAFELIFESAIAHYHTPTKLFCDSGRELYRVGEKYGDIWYALCMIWEYDNAYRTRGQFFFHILNKEDFIKNPRKETLRILKEMQSRDGLIGNKYNMFFQMTWILILFKKPVIEFINELNLELVRPDEIDFEWWRHSNYFKFF